MIHNCKYWVWFFTLSVFSVFHGEQGVCALHLESICRRVICNNRIKSLPRNLATLIDLKSREVDNGWMSRSQTIPVVWQWGHREHCLCNGSGVEANVRIAYMVHEWQLWYVNTVLCQARRNYRISSICHSPEEDSGHLWRVVPHAIKW